MSLSSTEEDLAAALIALALAGSRPDPSPGSTRAPSRWADPAGRLDSLPRTAADGWRAAAWRAGQRS